MKKKEDAMDSNTVFSIPLENRDYKRLEIRYTAVGKSIPSLVSQAIQDFLEKAWMPNKVTLKVLEDADKGIRGIEAESVEDLFNEL